MPNLASRARLNSSAVGARSSEPPLVDNVFPVGVGDVIIEIGALGVDDASTFIGSESTGAVWASGSIDSGLGVSDGFSVGGCCLSFSRERRTKEAIILNFFAVEHGLDLEPHASIKLNEDQRKPSQIW
jgi:hypothetical protein